MHMCCLLAGGVNRSDHLLMTYYLTCNMLDQTILFLVNKLGLDSFKKNVFSLI
ncbi:hypothetical protein Lalb_Chr12g0207481 [Lupinus albus]|uniref:Uncharacterized protein n=1 Tax=Lupinus albus TaxID=3870 RepID=A0A6A4PNI5_LUPAL|nr:hypothetical protein Lalb_Chr12g0207481 [Lupinus albus]